MSKAANADPLTLQQAIVYFADPQKCFDYAVKLRWPDGKVSCPRCGQDRHSFIKTRRIWFCNPCKKQFTLKVGTIFEDSPMGMDKWMAAMWMLVNCKNGISSCEIARDFGITQKSAWFMLHRLRLAMQNGSVVKLGSFGAPIEVDESFIGGKVRNMHKSRKNRLQAEHGRYAGKSVVLGMMERSTQGGGTEVRAAVIPDRTAQHMRSNVLANVHPGAEIFSDEFASSWRMDKVYDHSVVNHLECYVNGNIHTNGMENFWSLLKRQLHGTYISVEPFHLFRYVDEQAFRYNNRKATESERFQAAMSQVFGKRVTWDKLTGKDGAARQDQA